jgi:hypothetical protein
MSCGVEARAEMLKFLIGALCGVWGYKLFMNFRADYRDKRRVNWRTFGRAPQASTHRGKTDK